MIKQIWIKEIIKLNKTVLVLLLVHVAVAAYFWLRLKGGFAMMNPINIWVDIIEKHAFFFGRFEYLITLSGIALGIMQFYPEVEKKRFRISCHLPMNEYVMTSSMVGFGIGILSVLWVFDVVIVYSAGKVFFPYEIYSETAVVMSYWYLKAVVLYVFASAFTLEPVWKQKVKLAVMLAAFAGFFQVSVYNSDRIYLVVLTMLALIFIPIIFYPALRFRKGA